MRLSATKTNAKHRVRHVTSFESQLEREFVFPCIRNYLYRDKGSLGSAYPRTNAVDAEPLSASQLKVIHQSTCYYHQDLYYWRLRHCSRKCLRRAPAHHSTRQGIETRNVTRALTAMHRERA